MKKSLLLILMLMLSAAYMAKNEPEIRSLWVLPWNITSKAQIDEVILNAVLSGQTELLVEVRYRSDALYIPNRNSGRFLNPEPRYMYLSGNDFDPLAYVLEKAHLVNLKVQAWVVVFNATPLDSLRLAHNHIWLNHRDWITHNAAGKKMSNGEQFGYFIDPGVPEVQEYLLDVFSDIVVNYPELDGLHLDYIRYPSVQWGYHPISVKRFEEYKLQHPRTSWNEWRIKQVDEFLEKTYKRVKAINPNIMLSAAVFAFYEDAVNSYAQKWEEWLKRGIIDRIYPMLYNRDIEGFNRHLNTIDKMKRGKDIVMGIRAWNNDGSSLVPVVKRNGNGNGNGRYTIFDVAEKVDLIRKRDFAGIALFSYEGLKKDESLIELCKLIYPNTAQVIPENVIAEFIPPEPEIHPRTVIASNFSLEQENDHFRVGITVPRDGRWKWELKDKNHQTIYQRYRFYLEGDNTDYWNGILDDGNEVNKGDYFVHLFRDEDDFVYVIPVRYGEVESVMPDGGSRLKLDSRSGPGMTEDSVDSRSEPGMTETGSGMTGKDKTEQ